MAIMIPEVPHKFDPASLEGIMFDSLELLPDDYYVFHSFRISDVKSGVLHESETDFVLYHPKKGLLCLEAKAGHVKYTNGRWYYGSGIPMDNDGPFNQASANKWKLMNYIKDHKMASIISHCKFLHAVWFPSISQTDLHTMKLPPEADRAIILTKEALVSPQQYIDKIFDLDVTAGVQTDVSDQESKRLLRDILCPEFNVFPTASFENDLKKVVFHRMLREQSMILEFLREQRIAVINGAAGTGKTMIAIEKAKSHAKEGEKVLFLCFNSLLKDHLEKENSGTGIDFYTISGLACKLCMTSTPDYGKLKAKLEDMYFSETFPYQHVVIDEGQDFGIENIEEADILDQIRMIISDTESLNGSFYVFYDKLQLVHSSKMPKYLEDADCKLTLYRNCRNTQNIATTSLRPFSERKPKVKEGCIKGVPAKFFFCADNDLALITVDKEIDALKAEGIDNIVILTCKTESASIMASAIKNGLYRGKYVFSTCRKYKGLEADAVILVDLEKDTFEKKYIQLFYVGTSRAVIRLDVVTTLTDEDCSAILANTFNTVNSGKHPKRRLASVLNGTAIPVK